MNWQNELRTEARVMVPLRVIEEIDTKKYGDSKQLRPIARELLPWIDGLFPSGDPGPVRLMADATIELVLAERHVIGRATRTRKYWRSPTTCCGSPAG